MAEYEELSPRLKDALMNWQKTQNPFWTLLGMELVAVKKRWAKIIHRGTMTAIGDVEVRDGDKNLVAKGLTTYAIFKKDRLGEP